MEETIMGDWGLINKNEHGKLRYIDDLLFSIINISVQAVDIVNTLPKMEFE
ncbi:MAG: hypothetical protein J0H55_06660 [Chitinophagaceae bacterium]|nr:hypothetical protein [Chitinophagaceae bacterium]